MDKFYEFCLDDYAAPSCTSGYKYYYGTKEHFRKLLEKITAKGRTIKEAEIFQEFCNGNNQVMNVAGFTNVRFAKPVSILAEKKIDTHKKETYRYVNPYGFPYDLRIDCTDNHILIIKSGKKYVVAYSSIMRNPQYEDRFAESGWAEIDMLMGFPAMINIEGKSGDRVLSNNLYVVDKVFDSQLEAETYFNTMENVDYKLFFEDIFGDG
ncbi:MAG: hypothetical protein J6C62_09395 [Clostridia bacterium]|nr:hypothetical protein [Clostridia bacterium]